MSSKEKRPGYHRHLAFISWIGAMIAIFAFVMLATAILPVVNADDAAVGAPLPFFMIAITLLGVFWLGFYVLGARRKRDPGHDRKPSHSLDPDTPSSKAAPPTPR